MSDNKPEQELINQMTDLNGGVHNTGPDMNVLVSLYQGYGMGDAVQMSAVLRHARKYRPRWIIDFQGEEGRYCVGRGIAHNVFAYGAPYPHEHYDAEVQILLHDTWANWHDRPNTRVSSCLHERFGIAWDAECGRYQINVSDAVARRMDDIIPQNMVAIHYRGDSSPTKKDLTHNEADAICDAVLAMGYYPLIIDWRNESPLRYKPRVRTTGGYPFAKAWGRDAEFNAALISQCVAFVGIDSGPSKVASATDTPTLVVWTGHHPAPFHDPAPNTTHLVPHGYHGLEPVCGDPGVIAWFEANHSVRHYTSNPIIGVRKWLEDTLP